MGLTHFVPPRMMIQSNIEPFSTERMSMMKPQMVRLVDTGTGASTALTAPPKGLRRQSLLVPSTIHPIRRTPIHRNINLVLWKLDFQFLLNLLRVRPQLSFDALTRCERVSKAEYA